MKTILRSGLVLLAGLPVVWAQPRLPPGLMPVPPPQLELTDTNAVPMQVREYAVSAAVRGLQATVETTIVFHNPNRRLLEGELVFPLPDGAAVCGYALDIQGVLVDGVIVPKEKARVAFETETRRQIDPGLVEHIRGNLYRTRIYPLPANGSRTIRLAYTTPLAVAPDGDAALFLPLPRETLETLSVRIEVSADSPTPPELGGLGDRRFEQADNIWRVEAVTSHTAPAEDIWVALPKLPPQFSALETSPDGTVWFALSDLAPLDERDQEPKPIRYHILWDASGSRAGADLQKEYDLLTALEAESLALTVFRDVPEAVREFASAPELVAALKKVPFDGGTDFAALAAAVSGDGAIVLLFTDGIDTLSDQPIEFAGIQPVAVVSQTIADREALRQACAGALIDLQTTATAAALQEIRHPSPRVTGIQGTGIAKVQGIGRPATGRVTLLGQLTADEATLQVEYTGGVLSAPFVLRAEDARAGQALATAWAARRVHQLAPRADQFENELLALGRQFGLVSPATSLIVLETLDQWVRHEIEPPETLPEMRERWQQAKKSRPRDPKSAHARHRQQLEKLWKQHVEWWTTDFSAARKAKRRSDAQTAARRPFPSLRIASRASAPMEMSESLEVMADFAASPAMMASTADGPGQARAQTPTPTRQPTASIQIKPWSPDVPYLKAIRSAKKARRYEAYLTQRQEWAHSPAFYLDCAGYFLSQGERGLGLRILSNLAELRIEDAGLLRVLAWRLREAGELDRAIVVLRRVARLRGEEPQSFRDLALALAERGMAASHQGDLAEALDLYRQVAFTPWARHANTLPLFALEEFNALVAWISRQEWKADEAPAIPEVEEVFRQNLEMDLRIVMAWDADATDIDLHIIEPGGEEASYRHNRTSRGGLVTRDITDGYGPEAYLIRVAPPGPYVIQAHYFGSRQQTLVGPATVTVTAFTDWGRARQQQQTLTLRLDQPRQKVEVGRIVFAGGEHPALPADFSALRRGMTADEVLALLGEPRSRTEDVWIYGEDPRRVELRFDAAGRLERGVEILPGGNEIILIQ